MGIFVFVVLFTVGLTLAMNPEMAGRILDGWEEVIEEHSGPEPAEREISE